MLLILQPGPGRWFFRCLFLWSCTWIHVCSRLARVRAQLGCGTAALLFRYSFRLSPSSCPSLQGLAGSQTADLLDLRGQKDRNCPSLFTPGLAAPEHDFHGYPSVQAVAGPAWIPSDEQEPSSPDEGLGYTEQEPCGVWDTAAAVFGHVIHRIW